MRDQGAIRSQQGRNPLYTAEILKFFLKYYNKCQFCLNTRKKGILFKILKKTVNLKKNTSKNVNFV